MKKCSSWYVLIVCMIHWLAYTQPTMIFSLIPDQSEQPTGFVYDYTVHTDVNQAHHYRRRYTSGYTRDPVIMTYLATSADRSPSLSCAQQDQLLHAHHYYDDPGLLVRIKALSAYPAYIKKLYAQHQNSSWVGKAWNYVRGKVPPNLEKLYQEVVSNEHHTDQPSLLEKPQQPQHHAQSHCYDADIVARHIRSTTHTYMHDRTQALSRAAGASYQSYTQKYQLNNVSMQLLDQCELPYETIQQCIGDAYQQQIHHELLNTLDQAGIWYKQHAQNHVVQDLSTTLGNLSYSGLLANQHHEVLLATKISDFCGALLEFGTALIDGIGDGLAIATHDGWQSAQTTAIHLANACRDPTQAVCDVSEYALDSASSVLAISKTIIKRVSNAYIDLLHEVHDITAVCIDDPELGYQLLSTLSTCIVDDLEQGCATIQATAEYLVSTAPQWCTTGNLRSVAAFATEHGIKLCAHHCLVQAYATIAGHALRYAAQGAQTIGYHVIIEGKECFELARVIGNTIASCTEHTRQAIVSSKYLDVTSKIFSTYAHEYKELAVWTQQIAHLPTDIAHITGLHKILMTEYFIEHIFSLELKTFYKKSGGMRNKINGFHHYMEGFLEEHGVILLNKRICERTGIMLADIMYEGHMEGGKTFFPPSWTRKKVIEKIYESFHDLIEQPILDGGRWIVRGKTSENIVIRTVANELGELITSYPEFFKT